MEINTDVCGCGIKIRRRDARDRAPRREIRNTLRDVGPVGPISCVPHLPIVGACPDKSLLNFGRRNCEDDFSVELPKIIPDDSPRRYDAGWIVGREIRADYRPTLAAIRSFENYLTAIVDSVVVKGIDGERSSPVAAILDLIGRRIESVHPRTNRAGVLAARIPARDFISITRSPNDIWIGQVGNGEAGLAPAHSMIPAGFPRIQRQAWATHVSVVLHVAVEVVGNLIVDIDVVHLTDRQSNSMKTAAVYGRDVHAAVIGNYKTIGIGRVEPDVVRVSSPANFFEILPSIQGLVKRTVGHEDFTIARRRDRQPNVIAGTSNQRSLIVDRFPVLSPIVRSPQRTLVLRLNQGEHA